MRKWPGFLFFKTIKMEENMKKVLFALTAVLGLSLALVATSCGGGGGGSDDDDATPVAESGSTGTS